MDPLDLDEPLPPVARHVAHVLQERGPSTRKEIIEHTGSPPTSVDDALQYLVQEDLATRYRAWDDARALRYSLVV